jgi:hypothetical protein
VAEAEPQIAVTRSELAKALKQWETDAKANGWAERSDDARHADNADYLIHTIRLARGEGQAAQAAT